MNKRKPLTLERRQAMSDKMKGRKLSEEHKEKLRIARRKRKTPTKFERSVKAIQRDRKFNESLKNLSFKEETCLRMRKIFIEQWRLTKLEADKKVDCFRKNFNIEEPLNLPKLFED